MIIYDRRELLIANKTCSTIFKCVSDYVRNVNEMKHVLLVLFWT